MTARERSELAQGSGAATIHGKRTADVPDTRGQRRAGDHAVELVLRQPGHEIAGGVWAVRDTVAARRVEHVEPCGRQPFTGVRAWRVEGIRLTQVVGLGGGELHRGVRRRSSLTGKRKTAMANIPSPGQRVPPGAERREEAPASHVWDSLMMAQRSLSAMPLQRSCG